MKKPQKQTSVITLELFSLLMVCSLFAGLKYTQSASTSASVSKSSSASAAENATKRKTRISSNRVDFTVPYEALCVAYDLDVESHDTDIPLNWIELLAYTATKNGGTFSNESARFITQTATDLSNRSTTMTKPAHKGSEKLRLFFRSIYGCLRRISSTPPIRCSMIAHTISETKNAMPSTANCANGSAIAL